MAPRLAYVADGRLRTIGAGETSARDFDSPFATQVRERAASLDRRTAWKEGGSSFAAAAFRGSARERPAQELRFVNVARGPAAGEMVHALHTGAVSGIFVVDADGAERRVFHTERFDVRHVAARPGDELLACAVTRGATTNIAVVRTDGSDLMDVTEGDSLDLAPSWVPGPGHRIVFQSAGLARGGTGTGGRSPFSVALVDADAGRLETLAEDPGCDLLLPRMTADGTLHYIRCPHAAPKAPLSRVVASIVSWPFRFAAGVFAFLDMFAKHRGAGGGPRLATNGGSPGLDDRRLKDLLVDGRFGEASPDDDGTDAREPSSVSSAWELVRRSPDGTLEVVATRVLAYDVADDGTLAWTDGNRLRLRRPGGPIEDVGRDHLIHAIAWLA